MQSTRRTGPAYSLGDRVPLKSKFATDAVYDIPSSFGKQGASVKKSAPGYSLGKRTVVRPLANTPGPGEYDPTARANTPEYSFGSPDRISSKVCAFLV